MTAILRAIVTRIIGPRYCQTEREWMASRYPHLVIVDWTDGTD